MLSIIKESEKTATIKFDCSFFVLDDVIIIS